MRVIDPRQRGWLDSRRRGLDETVPEIEAPRPEPIPTPDVSDSDWGAFTEATEARS